MACNKRLDKYVVDSSQRDSDRDVVDRCCASVSDIAVGVGEADTARWPSTASEGGVVGGASTPFETLKFDERNADFILLLWYMFKELIATRPKYPDDAN